MTKTFVEQSETLRESGGFSLY